jgi:hypothetical protein
VGRNYLSLVHSYGLWALFSRYWALRLYLVFLFLYCFSSCVTIWRLFLKNEEESSALLKKRKEEEALLSDIVMLLFYGRR